MAITNLLAVATSMSACAERMLAAGDLVRVSLKYASEVPDVFADVEVQAKNDEGRFLAHWRLLPEAPAIMLQGPLTFRVYRVKGRVGVYVEEADVETTPTAWHFAAPASGTNNTTPVTIKAAAGAGLRNYVTGLQLVHEGVLVGTEVLLRDGSEGAALWRGKIHPAASNFAIDFAQPLRGTANTLLEYVLLGSTSGAVYINAQGYSAP